jgi:hypothetical protein
MGRGQPTRIVCANDRVSAGITQVFLTELGSKREKRQNSGVKEKKNRLPTLGSSRVYLEETRGAHGRVHVEKLECFIFGDPNLNQLNLPTTNNSRTDGYH